MRHWPQRKMGWLAVAIEKMDTRFGELTYRIDRLFDGRGGLAFGGQHHVDYNAHGKEPRTPRSEPLRCSSLHPPDKDPRASQ
jgi:hypothetical protein